MFRKFLKKVLGKRLLAWLRKKRNYKLTNHFYRYSLERCMAYSGAFECNTREKALAQLIMTYHIVEKGLTMPNRRFIFGKKILLDLMSLIKSFEQTYDAQEPQLLHAIGVIKSYWALHEHLTMEDDVDHKAFWQEIQTFLKAYPRIPIALQPHVKRSDFYAKKEAAFPEFAFARHTLRHYAPVTLSRERINKAVQIALSTPTACNRQYCHVHAISNKQTIANLLEIQAGNRGFGHLADKLLIVTADLQGIQGIAERDDLFTNGGMFLMNLCYALFYQEIAHCILNWSRTPEADIKARTLIDLPPSETIIAMLTCGETPDEFDVAASPRRPLNDLFTWRD